MLPKLTRLWKSVKGNLVIAFVLLSVVFVDIFVLYLLNEKVAEEKRELIRYYHIEQLDAASRSADEVFRKIAANAPDEEVHAVADSFLRQDNMFYRFEFYPFISPQQTLPAKEPSFTHEIGGKKASLNNFRNCLFTRNFSHDARFRKTLGLFYVYYATPRNSPEIEKVVTKYRILAGLFLLFSGVLVYLMLRQIVLPLYRVSQALETMSEEYIPLLERPRANIEVSYNNVARNARITQLSVLLNELVSDTPEEMLRGEDPVVSACRKIPSLICDFMNFARVVLFHRDDSTGNFEWGFGYDVRTGELQIPDTFGEGIDLESLTRRKGCLITQETNWLASAGQPSPAGATERCAVVPILHNNRAICHAALWPARDNVADDELRHTAEIVRGELEEVLMKIIGRRSLLDKEKNQVSIHLSTNLGHDLTNIIATSKWDLDTLKKGIEMGIVKIHGQPIQEQRFKESVDGLLNNTRMLQEVVNIYRAFGYANRPTYERVEVHPLIRQLAHLFTLSTSKSVNISFDFRAADPIWVLEPRLIKLVLFNLLSNAVQAISKMQELGEPTTGEIRIQTDLTEEGWLSISILDAGTGFRNEQGKPMTRSELRKIFRYGYTTKRDEARGGLGLSWVWTIVTEFHQGQIIPSNRPEGGAKMTVLIPPLEHKLAGQDKTALSQQPMM